MKNIKKQSVRLSAFIKPENYKLLIKPDLEGFTFEGEETISIKLEKSVASITLHAKELDISEVEYQVARIKYQAREIKYDNKSETATFIFARNLPKGRGALNLKFKGILNDHMRGFYRSRYLHNGKEKHLATTQFEATDARRAFPCFDEPAQKAIFDITVMVPPGLTAISNTVESKITEHESGYKVVEFAPTPKMSTYLVAFIVGDFEFIEGKTKSGTAVRVFVTPGKKHQAKFALECAIKTLEFYNKYFDIPYPLPILDLIAIPDFSHGAMENWGAVTYRESALLVDPENSSAANKQWVALVIAHELAHQWFGNLVTMQWWTDLWLNEGFASYIEYLAVDHLFPSWDIWTQFAYNDLGIALKLDALKSTHPIEVEVRHPDEIGEIFDEVSYSKGASVIRMLANYLGERDFMDGLRHYLKKHAYQNTRTVDLWRAFERISKKPVSKIMKNWTGKPGYPLIKVIQKPRGIGLAQSRFFSSPLSKKQAKDKTLWDIPVKISNDKLQISNEILKAKSQTLTKPQGQMFKLNFGESSLVRVDYPAQLLQKLHGPIKSKKLPALDRLGLIRDAFALAESGDLPSAQALELAMHYINENDYTVWLELVSGLHSVDNLLAGQNFQSQFRHFAVGLLKQMLKNVGWKAQANEPHTKSLLRSLILSASGNFKNPEVILEAKNRFDGWMRKNKKITPDLRGVVYSVAAENGGHKEHSFLINAYKTEALHEEKNRIGRALGLFNSEALVKKTLEFALSEGVRPQDTPGIFLSCWQNQNQRAQVWKFTKQHWQELLKRYPSSGHMLNRFIKPAGLFADKARAKEVGNFFKAHKAPGAQRAIEQVVEKILSNAEWLGRDGGKIQNWLMQ